MYSKIRLTDNQGLLLGEAVDGNLQVQRGGALANTAGDIVVGTVAGAEPAAVVTGLTDGDTTQVGADTWGELECFRFANRMFTYRA